MKRVILLCLLWSSLVVNAQQIGGGISFIKPSGDLGRIFKPTLGIEISTLDFEKGKIIWGASLGFHRFKPHKDTIRIYSIKSDGSGTTLSGGYMSFKSYYAIPVIFHFKYRIREKGVSPFLGSDVLAHFGDYKLETVTASVDSYEESMHGSIGINPHIGIMYNKEASNFLLGLGRTMSIGTFGKTAFWKLTMGYYYDF